MTSLHPEESTEWRGRGCSCLEAAPRFHLTSSHLDSCRNLPLFLPLLSLFPISPQAAANIFLLNYSSDYVIPQGVHFNNSTLTVKLNGNISN